MTWPTAKAQIIDMIEGISASVAEGAYRESFEHDPSFFLAEQIGQSRRFGVRAVGASTKALATGASSRRTFSECQLSVDYLAMHDDDELDSTIWRDYEAIRERLFDVTQWGQPSSTILSVSQSDLALDAVAEDVENDDGAFVGRRLTISFVVLHEGA